MNKFGNILTRLINVLYGIGWIGIFILVILVILAYKPYQYVNSQESYISCLPGNEKVLFNKLDEYVRSLNVSLITREEKANRICTDIIENNLQYRPSTDRLLQYFGDKAEIYSKYDDAWFPNNESNRNTIVQNVKNELPRVIYKEELIYSTQGSWLKTVFYAALTFAISSIILDLAKSVILYIVKGRKIKLKDFLIMYIFKLSITTN